MSEYTTTLARRRTHVLASSYRTFYRRPVDIAAAHGVWLTDHDGHTYLDCYNNVPVIGHSHPRIAEAVDRELGRANTHTRYLSEPTVACAEQLLAHLPDTLDTMVFTNSGSEANDLALQVARFVTGRRGIIVTTNAYHGTTYLAQSVSPSLSGRRDTPGVAYVGVPGQDAADPSAEFADRTRAAVAELNAAGLDVAALLVDTTLTSDGIVTDPAGLLGGAAEVVRAAGGLVIADEVQAGFGRTGTWWGFTRHGMTPDLVTLGKPMGSGVPVAALVGRTDILDRYGARFRYFNTFAGSPAAAAAASAVLSVIEEDGLVEAAAATGILVRDALQAAADLLPGDNRVRGAGMMNGLDLAASPVDAADLAEDLRDHGVLVGTTGADGQTVKVRPPLVFGEPEVAVFRDRLLDVAGAYR